MASDSKLANNAVTKEIESRIKQIPEHIFEVFLEIREPIDKELPEILIKYPTDFTDDILKTAANFAYPCKTPSDEQSEHFAFVVLDATGTLFRFGYCRRSNREATCLCIVSYYPWFETFYTILNDLSQIINAKSFYDPSQPSVLTADMERLLSLLYDYKLMSNEEFFKNEGKEVIEINGLTKTYTYNRPDPRKLPSMLSSRNFTVMFSRLGPDIMLPLFSHLLFERRILFVSSKLFHLTACAYGCLHLIYPMHWQSIFLPILPASMTWTTQCTSPYIIGMHTNVFSTLNLEELGDVVIVNIDERTLTSQYDDLSSFPKYLSRSMKKGIQQSSQLAGDHLARVFLRAMAFATGNYANGFTFKNEKLDFDRDLYLEQYLGTHVHAFMSAVANTQMFEQFSRYRTYVQLQRETDVDEFDLEVKNLERIQQSKKFKTNKKIYKILEKYVKDGTIIPSSTNAPKDRPKAKRRKSLIDTKDERSKAANPILEQVQNKAGKFQIAMNKAGQRVASEASSVRNNLTSKTDNSNRLNPTKSILQSSTPDLLNEKSIPYERFNSDGNGFSSQPQLVNDAQISSSSSSSRSSTPELERRKSDPLINLDIDDNPLLPSPIVLNVINTSPSTAIARQIPQIDSKIKQLQSELQHKVQTFDGKRVDPREEYGNQQTEIKKLVKQFDPLDDSNYINKIDRSTAPSAPCQAKNTNDFFPSFSVTFRSDDQSTMSNRHPSVYESIPSNRVNTILQNIQTNYGTTSRFNLRPTYSMPQQQQQQQNNLIRFSPASTAPAALFPKLYSSIPVDTTLSFDPLEPSNEQTVYPNVSISSTETNGSNLIDFN